MLPQIENRIEKTPPENFRKGRGTNNKIFAVVYHVEDGTERGTEEWFANPLAHVSAHYSVSLGGDIKQYVDEADSAYHAGRVNNPLPNVPPQVLEQPNAYTIGIEHEGTGTDTWPAEQIEASAQLLADICKRNKIPIDRNHVVLHCEIYSLKECPGLCPIQQIVDRAKVINTAA